MHTRVAVVISFHSFRNYATILPNQEKLKDIQRKALITEYYVILKSKWLLIRRYTFW